jgi:steroid delta-isomerase-like uncharacterized protein
MVRQSGSVEEVLTGVPGFVAYHALREGGGLTTVTICATAQGAQESTQRAAAWVREHLPGISLAAPDVSGGEVFLQFAGRDGTDSRQQANAALVREVHAAWNRRDFDRIVAQTAEEFDWVMVPTGQTFRGLAGIRQYAQGWATAFPDGQIEDTRVTAGDSGAVVEFIGRGTHTGPLVSPAGEIPPTGRRIELTFCEAYRIKNGKIVGGAIYFDMAGMLQQLGLMPRQPAAATA